MLTIENLYKINHKTLGKDNFYVRSIREVSDNMYLIMITNAAAEYQLQLSRTPINSFYELFCPYTTRRIYLRLWQIESIDRFLDNIGIVGIK